MAINDFSSIIQLSATLLIAFVAVDYVKSYIGQLVERVFGFENFIKSSFDECRHQLTDKETLDNLEPVLINGKSTNAAIEEEKRRTETLTKEIDDTEEEMLEMTKSACYVRSMPSVCLFLFMCSVAVLLSGAVEYRFEDFSHIFVSIFCILSMLYLLWGWFEGEKEKQHGYANFFSLRCSILWFFIIFSIAAFGSLYLFFKAVSCKPLFNSSWWYCILAFVLLTFINYLVFSFKIYSNTGKMKNYIRQRQSNLMEKCEKSKRDVSDLMATVRVDSKIKVDGV